MYVIFSIDGQDNPLKRAQFQGYFYGSALKTGNLIPMIGKWQGEYEYSYICNEADFQTLVHDGGFVLDQQEILTVTACNKQYVTSHKRGITGKYLGCMKQVSKQEAEASDGYSYRPDLGKYFIIVQGNPNTVPASQAWEQKEAMRHIKAALELLAA